MSSVFGLFSTSVSWLDSLLMTLIVLYLGSRPNLSLHLLLSVLSLWLFYQLCSSALTTQVTIDKRLLNEISREEKRVSQFIKNIEGKNPLEQLDSLETVNGILAGIYQKRVDIGNVRTILDSLKSFKSQTVLYLKVPDDYGKIKLTPVSEFLNTIDLKDTSRLINACVILQFNLNEMAQYKAYQQLNQQDSIKSPILAEMTTFLSSTVGFPDFKDDIAQHVLWIVIYLYGTLIALFLYLYEMYYNDNHNKVVFEGDDLFYKYGRPIFSLIVPIGLKDRTSQDIAAMNGSLMNAFFENLGESYTGLNGYTQEFVSVQDQKNRKDDRLFFKARFDTQRKSTLHYFIYTQPVGEQILIHHTACVQGHHSWYHALSFVTWAPLTIWFWLYSYYKKRFTILNRLNTRFDTSSYDTIDLKSYFQSITFNLMVTTRNFAKSNNLLTEELNSLIVSTINNTQNVKVAKSSKISLGNISFTNTNQA